MRKKVEIHTDGACAGNPGKGGWAAILRYKGTEKEITGYEENTTNNRMEIKAAIEALKALIEPCRAEIFSDSSYLVKAFEENWLEIWKRNGWKTAGKDEVKNRDLWLELDELTARHTVKWVKVKGHADNEGNLRCDRLAKQEIEKRESVQDV